MLHTGRPVDAHEALSMGLADRVVPAGTARSAINQAGLPLEQALEMEAAGAAEAKRLEAQAGARRFTEGHGRGGTTATS